MIRRWVEYFSELRLRAACDPPSSDPMPEPPVEIPAPETPRWLLDLWEYNEARARQAG